MKNVDEKKYILLKKEGKVVLKHIEPSMVSEVNNKCKLHLCAANCKNFGVFTCPKIGDRNKKTIDKYEFITDGYQTYSSKKKLEEFKVTGCKNYEKTQQKKLTAEDKRRISAAKDGILTAYFETGSADEAYVRQYMQMIRGELLNAEGKTVSDEVIIYKILKQPDAEALLNELLEYKKKEIANKSKLKPSTLEKKVKFIREIETELAKLRNAREAKENAHRLSIEALTEKGIKEHKIQKIK